MSLHRRAAKRDAAEPAIVSALEALGCVVWRVSGKGLPDLVVFHKRRMPLHPLAETMARQRSIFVADVKGPKDGPTPAQVETWTTLTNLGFSVFILRTPEDAQKMLNNALQPWEPEPQRAQVNWAHVEAHRNRWCACFPTNNQPRNAMPRKGDAAKVLDREHHETLSRIQRLAESAKAMVTRTAYTPPHSTPVDAAKEAEAFAPAACPYETCSGDCEHGRP